MEDLENQKSERCVGDSEIETSASDNKITFGLPNNVAISQDLDLGRDLRVVRAISGDNLNINAINLNNSTIRITGSDEDNEDLILKPDNADGEVRVGGTAEQNGNTAAAHRRNLRVFGDILPQRRITFQS